MAGWIYLFLAIGLEVTGTISMKLSDGLARLWPSVIMFACYAAAFALLALAVKTINLSVAYAIWAGLGTALIAVIGVHVFAEPLGWAKVLFLALIVIGVVGLNLSGAPADH